MRSAIVVGGGLGGLTAAGLLGRAGLRVTLLEATPDLGGKSRRVTLDVQRIDTGPEILTFLGIWEELLRRWDGLGGDSGGLRKSPASTSGACPNSAPTTTGTSRARCRSRRATRGARPGSATSPSTQHSGRT
jgi:phytoene dehydrogenase-like protein